MKLRFEWGQEKSHANLLKHGIGFDQAVELLRSNDNSLEIYDIEHDEDEDRFISIGPVNEQVIMVVWTEAGEDSIRIISARPVTRRELFMYLKFMDCQR